MKTSIPKIVEKKWYLIDAKDLVLGRLATKIADILRGKNKATYTPHMDTGDYVIVVNAEKIKLTGKKLKDKLYYRHSGYLGNLKKMRTEEVLEKQPTMVLYNAVKGMLPKNKLRNIFLNKLHIYAGEEHKHQAQVPEPLKF